MKLIRSKNPIGKSMGYIETLSVVLNPQDNSGEQVILSVDVYDNGDGLPKGLFTNTHLETGCYGIHATKTSLHAIPFQNLAIACQLISQELPAT